MTTHLIVKYAIESQWRLQIEIARTIKIPRGAVKHPYSPIKVRKCKSMYSQRIEWSNSEDLLPLNIFSPRNRQETLALSRTKSFTYSASMNYNPLRPAHITCCTISAKNVEKGQGWSHVVWEHVRIKGSPGSYSQQPREGSDRSPVEAGAHEPRFASSRVARPALFRRVYTHTCDMFHLHDVSRRRHIGCCGITRALRVQQLWHIINLLWLPNAIRGIHYLYATHPRNRKII